jgi:hypothetical protein
MKENTLDLQYHAKIFVGHLEQEIRSLIKVQDEARKVSRSGKPTRLKKLLSDKLFSTRIDFESRCRQTLTPVGLLDLLELPYRVGNKLYNETKEKNLHEND